MSTHLLSTSRVINILIHTERNSKHLDELLASAPKFPIENKSGDGDILRVIEMYCAGGKAAGAIRTCFYAMYLCPGGTNLNSWSSSLIDCECGLPRLELKEVQ